MAFFLANESPNFIELEMLAGKIAHLDIQDSRAALPHANAEPHNGIAVHARNPLNGADA
jgi:hypothetical protein